ncbi:CPBP family glutamic-type intramembrane protease [Runella sp.]|uniref:CPBP family glutamic-type intramembrane protease n=1 Tax=Runella sp. TaxID=1960881 RepID=UPI003D14F435
MKKQFLFLKYFIQNPYNFNNVTAPEKSVITLLKLCTSCFIFALIYGFSLALLSGLSIVFFNYKLYEIFKSESIVSFKHSASKSYYIINIILLSPVYEELAFRLCLLVTKSTVAISFALVFLYYSGPIWAIEKFGISIFLRLLIAVLLAIIILSNDSIYTYLKTKKEHIFYISLFLFSYTHFFNFKPLTGEKLLFSPVLALPYFVYGAIFSYIRIYYGITYSIFIHILLNMASIIIFG